jgi:hypothetical protein
MGITYCAGEEECTLRGLYQGVSILVCMLIWLSNSTGNTTKISIPSEHALSASLFVVAEDAAHGQLHHSSPRPNDHVTSDEGPTALRL